MRRFVFFVLILILPAVAWAQENSASRPFDPYKITLTVEHFQPVIDALKQNVFLPIDFTATQENRGPFGPGSRFGYIADKHHGPWNDALDGRDYWWDCYIHGVHSDGSYAGLLNFTIDLITGDLHSLKYSPHGEVNTYLPKANMILFQDFKMATQISAQAFADTKEYKSLKESGYIPSDYRNVETIIRESNYIHQHHSVSGRLLLDPNCWEKVIELGFVGSQAVEVHYLRNQHTHRVSRVEFYPFRGIHNHHSIHKLDLIIGKGTAGQLIQGLVRVDVMSPEALAHKDDSLAYIESQREKYEVFKAEVERNQQAVVKAPWGLLNIMLRKFDLVAIDREIRKRNAPKPAEPKIIAPKVEDPREKITQDLNAIVPELSQAQNKTAEVLLLQVSVPFRTLQTEVGKERLYAPQFLDIRDLALATYGRLGKLLDASPRSLCDQYDDLVTQEKEWIAELDSHISETYLQSEEYDATLDIIRELREGRLKILSDFSSRLANSAKAHIKTDGKVKDPVRAYIEELSQNTAKINKKFGIATATDPEGKESQGILSRLPKITFGPDPNESKGGTVVGMGLGGAQEMFGGAYHSDQNPDQATFNPFQRQYTPQDFYLAINAMKNRGLLPQDFTPTYENKGELGPHSRIAVLRETARGPWDKDPQGRKFWWECYIHGEDAEGNYAGLVHLKINLKTGELWEAEYSPFGDVLTYLPYDAVVLYEDLKLATRISAHAFYDVRTYKSLGESGYVPAGYRIDPKSPPIKRQDKPEDKIRHEYKVFEFGYVGDQQVEVHYFMRETGEVSQVEFYPHRTSRGTQHKIDVIVGKTPDGRPIRKYFRIDLMNKGALIAARADDTLKFIADNAPRHQKLMTQLQFAKKNVKTFFSSRLSGITFGKNRRGETSGGTYVGMLFGGAQGMIGGRRAADPRQIIDDDFRKLLEAQTVEEALEMATRIAPVRIWPPDTAVQYGKQYVRTEQEASRLKEHVIYQGTFYDPIINVICIHETSLRPEVVIYEAYLALIENHIPKSISGDVTATQILRNPRAANRVIFKFIEEEFGRELRERVGLPRTSDEYEVAQSIYAFRHLFGWSEQQINDLISNIIEQIREVVPQNMSHQDISPQSIRQKLPQIENLKDPVNEDLEKQKSVEDLFMSLELAKTADEAKVLFYKVSSEIEKLTSDRRTFFIKKQLQYLEHSAHRNQIMSTVGDVGNFASGLFVKHVMEDLESQFVHGEDPRHMLELIQHWDSVLYDYAYFGVGGKMGTVVYDVTLSKLYAKAYNAFYAETYTQILRSLSLPEMAAERALLMKMYPSRSLLGQFLRSQAGALAAFAFSQYMNTGRIDAVNIASFQMSYLLTNLVVTSLTQGAFSELGAFLFSQGGKSLWLLGGPYGALVKAIQMGVSLYAADKLSPHVERAFHQMASNFKEDDAEALRYAMHERLKGNLSTEEIVSTISEINLSLETSYQNRLFELFQVLAVKEKSETEYFDTHHYVRALEIQKEACEEKLESAEVQSQYSVVNSNVALERTYSEEYWGAYTTLYGLPGDKNTGLIAEIREGNENKWAWMPEYMAGLEKLQRKHQDLYQTKLNELRGNLFRGDLIEVYMALKGENNEESRRTLFTKYRALKEELARGKINPMEDKAQMAEALAQGMAGAVGPGPGFIPPNAKSRVMKSMFEKYLEEMAYFEYKADHEQDLEKKSIYRVQAIQLQLKTDAQLDWIQNPFQTPENPEAESQLDQLLTYQK